MEIICAGNSLNCVKWLIDWAASWILNRLSKCTTPASTLLLSILNVSGVELYSLVTARNVFVKCTKTCIGNFFSKLIPTTCCVFKEVAILKLPDLHRYKIGVYMFKIVNFQSYPTLQSVLRLEYPQHH